MLLKLACSRRRCGNEYNLLRFMIYLIFDNNGNPKVEI